MPFAESITILIFDRPIPNAVEGVHYVKTWDIATMGDLTGREFILAGWGVSGGIREVGNDWTDEPIFHRGYNVIDEVTDNMLILDMDRPEDGGL